MFYDSIDVVFQEVPNEISLVFLMSGCPLQCKGCHSAYSWKTCDKNVLTEEFFEAHIKKYKGLITCILFLGGEWNDSFINYLSIAKNNGFKTCLYTGLEIDEIEKNILELLDFIKVGKWDSTLGTLNTPTTNQQFLKLPEKENLNHLFQRNNDATTHSKSSQD